jgi:hypothetical protein
MRHHNEEQLSFAPPPGSHFFDSVPVFHDQEDTYYEGTNFPDQEK